MTGKDLMRIEGEGEVEGRKGKQSAPMDGFSFKVQKIRSPQNLSNSDDYQQFS